MSPPFIQTVLQITQYTPTSANPTTFPSTTQSLLSPIQVLQTPATVEKETYVTATELAILMLILLLMMILLLWILFLTMNFMVRYLTGSLEAGQKRRRRCGGGHEEEGMCKAHFRAEGFGEKMRLLVGEGMASALDSEGEVGGARRRSAE